MMINYYLNESASDEEILDKLPDEKVDQIEDLLKKVTKKSVDLEKIAQKENPKKDSEEKGDEKDSKKKGKEDEAESKNEAVGTVATIAVATIVPLILEAGGSFANLINRTLGLKFTKQEFKQFKFLKKVLGVYKGLLSRGFGDLHYGGKTFRYSWEGGGGGAGEKWTELGKKADEELKKMGWSGDPQIYYKSGLKKDLTKKESLHRFGHLVKFESYLNEEINPFGLFGKKKDKSQSEKNPVEDKEKDKKDWKESQKLFGDDHKHGSEAYDSNWEPSYTKEDAEFVENEIDRINELMKTNLPIDTTIGNKLKSAGHKLHAAYTYPIRLFLKGIAWYYNWKWMKNKENRTIAANVIYAFAMLLFTGMLIWDKLSHLHGVSAYSEMILKNYKGGVSLEEFVTGLVAIWKGKG